MNNKDLEKLAIKRLNSKKIQAMKNKYVNSLLIKKINKIV